MLYQSPGLSNQNCVNDQLLMPGYSTWHVYLEYIEFIKGSRGVHGKLTSNRDRNLKAT